MIKPDTVVKPDPTVTDAQYLRRVRSLVDNKIALLSVCAIDNAPATSVALTIDANGAVASAHIGGSAPAGMHRCLRDRFKVMRFPSPPRSPMNVVFPLVFLPRKPPAAPVQTTPTPGQAD